MEQESKQENKTNIEILAYFFNLAQVGNCFGSIAEDSCNSP